MGLPTGTVTFLFTDIEGSTALWESHPATTREGLARHDAILASSVENRGGRIFSTSGQSLQGLAWAASVLRTEDAVLAFREALADLYSIRFWMYVWIVVETLGTYWVGSGELEVGAIVMGHLTAHGHSHATLIGSRDAALRILATHPETAGLMTSGAHMDRDALVAFILERLG